MPTMLDDEDECGDGYTLHSTNIQHKALSACSTSIWRKVAAKNGPRLCAAGLKPFFCPNIFLQRYLLKLILYCIKLLENKKLNLNLSLYQLFKHSLRGVGSGKMRPRFQKRGRGVRYLGKISE